MNQEVLIHLLDHIGPRPATNTGHNCLVQLLQLECNTEHLLEEG